MIEDYLNSKSFTPGQPNSSDKNGEKVSKRVENTLEKGEIAHNEQFLFSYSVFFERLVHQTYKNKGVFGKGLSTISKSSFTYFACFLRVPLTLYHTIPTFNDLEKSSL